MSDDELRELQMYGLEILKAVDRFCKKNNIKYSMGEGSLLGAVRHHGFIPWDDDLDIYMTRENFDKFISTFDSEGFRVEYFNTMDRYWLPFAKVRMLRKTKFSTPIIAKVSEYTGPRIDVLPLDYVPELCSDGQDRQGKKIKFWKMILRNKVIPGRKKKKINYLIVPFAKMLPYKFIVSRLNHYMKLYNSEEHNYTVCATGDYHVRKETFPVNYFEELEDCKFEDMVVPVSKYYDKVLTQIYGNYMQLPPEEKRKVKHDVIVRK